MIDFVYSGKYHLELIMSSALSSIYIACIAIGLVASFNDSRDAQEAENYGTDVSKGYQPEPRF